MGKWLDSRAGWEWLRVCGRLTLTRSGDEIADYFVQALAGLLKIEPPSEVTGAPLRPRFNVAPSQPVLTITPEAPGTPLAEGRGVFGWRRWGLVPSWARDPSIGQRMFNARCETVSEKPAFRTAYRRRRCVVVADGFYEWSPRSAGHRPFHFRSRTAPLLCFAGLYETWERGGARSTRFPTEVIESCTVMTTTANRDLSDVHSRMPVLLNPRQCATWLDCASDRREVEALLHPAEDGALDRIEVGRHVNDPRNDDARCLQPLSEAEQARNEMAVGKEFVATQGQLFPAEIDFGGAGDREGRR